LKEKKMETRNEKGGSRQSKGSTAGKGQGKMNQRTETAAGRSDASTATKTRSRPHTKNDGNGMLSGVNSSQVLTALGVVAGGALLYKGAKALTGSGKGRAYDKKAIIDINTTLKVKRPKEELYAYWRNLENLPGFMSHIEDVRELSDKKSEWTAEV